MAGVTLSSQELESYFFHSSTPSSQQWQASQRLQECISQAESSEEHRALFASQCFQLFSDGQKSIQIRFSALTTLSRLPINELERQQVRNYLLYQFGSSAKGEQQPPAFLRNKAAMILMQHILLDVPERWSTMIQDMTALAQSNPLLFLKTCETLLEDFLTNDTDRESVRRVKDLLKGYSAGQTTDQASQASQSTTQGNTPLEQLFGITVQILGISLQQQTQPNSFGDKDLPVLAIDTIKAFFMWTELSFLGHSNANTALELLLLGFQPQRSTEVQLSSLAAWCEWTTSASMNATTSITNTNDPKLPVMSTVLERLHESNLLPYTGESDAEIEVVIEVAKLVNMFGLEILPLREHIVEQASQTGEDISSNPVVVLFNKILDMFFRGLAYDDIDVSGAVIPLANRLAQSLHDETLETNVHLGLRQHLPQILNTFYRQLKYPNDFTYDFEDDTNAEEEIYRRELCKLFVKLVNAIPDVCLQFVGEATSQLLQQAQPNPHDAEATLRLIFHYCEGIKPPPGVKIVLKNESFLSILTAVHRSYIMKLKHEEMLCLYYETSVRYCLFYKNESNQELLSRLLDAITGISGLQHPSAKVRSRCAYLFLRLVKALVSLLKPLVETAVKGISNLLAADLAIRPDDTLYLFESIGLLLGKAGLPASEQQQYLAAIMTPHVQTIKGVLSSQGITNDAETAGQSLAHSVAAIAFLSKGFSKLPAEEIQQILVEATSITLEVLRALPSSEDVRNKVMVFLQRMILTIGSKVLEPMPSFLSLLVEHCTSDDVLFVAQIFNQCCIKFKDLAAPAIDVPLNPFLRKCESLVTDIGANHGEANIPPHLYTEQLTIQKLAFTVLQHIVTHKATATLTSNTNAAHLETTFGLLKMGALVPDPVIQRTCLKFFIELNAQWSEASPGPYNQGLVAFCCQLLIPSVWQNMMKPSFDQTDAQQARNVAEMAVLLWAIHQKHSVQAVQTALQASSRWPSSCDTGLHAATDVKSLETCLLEALKYKSS